MKWILFIILATALSLISGCADVADAEDSPATTPVEQQEVNERSGFASGTTWIAIVTTWNPINRTIDKEFSSEIECWNYYEGGTGESKFGSQVLDHQDNPPTKDFNFGPDHLEYPIRTYHGKDGSGSIWLTCDIKGRYKDL